MITFLTAVKYSSSVLSAYNNMTFLYNTAWSYGSTQNPTYPLAFFYVKDMHEVQDSEVSSRPLLCYNGANEEQSQNSTNVDSTLNIIADNIVTKPKMYNLDILVPATINDYLNMANYRYDLTTHAFVTDMIGKSVGVGTPNEENLEIFDTIDKINTTAVTLIRNVLSVMTNVNFGNTEMFTNENIGKLITNGVHTASKDYNKESFVEMCSSRCVLKLKTHEGWRYKYVAVVSYDIHKVGTEKNVYQASLKVTELPILTVLSERSKGILSDAWQNNIIYNVSEHLKTFVDSQEIK